MRIRIKKYCEHQIVIAIDSKGDSKIDTINETFKTGEIYDVNILDDKKETIDLQFGDRSCAFNFPKDRYEVIGD